jgi:GntR family transcriptional regulator / MocR family aminotransferase
VLVTPAHQYPLGSVLAAERRAALVACARATGGVVLEDDYDAEFRYDRDPVGAVQGIAPDATVLLGSVAKTLAPALRIGWMAVPPRFLPAVERARRARDSQPAALDHLAFDDLVESGRYDRHLRLLRRRYRERRDVAVAVLTEAGFGDRLVGIAAGLQIVVLLPGADDVAICDRLAERSVATAPLSRYAAHEPAQGLVLGYGAADTSSLRAGLAIVVDEMAGPAGGATGPLPSRR